MDSDKYAGLGRIVDPDDEPELAKQVSELMEAKYQWSDGLIVELRPEPGTLQRQLSQASFQIQTIVIGPNSFVHGISHARVRAYIDDSTRLLGNCIDSFKPSFY